jgi:hypothetical protein
MNISPLQQQVRDLISQDRLEQAIALLLSATEETDLHNDVLLQSSAFQSWKKASKSGLISEADKKLQRNRIVHALLQIAGELPEDAVAKSGTIPLPPSPPSEEEERGGEETENSASPSLFPAITGLGLLLGIVGLLVFVPCPSGPQFLVFRIALARAVAGLAAVIPGFFEFGHKKMVSAGGALAVFAFVYLINPAQSTGEDRCNQPVDFTIFLQDASGKTVLKNEGTLSLRLENDRRSESIDADGSVSFKRLPAQAANDTVSVELEASGWLFDNGTTSTRLPLTGNNGTLTIQRDSSLYCCISGSVRDENNRFLPGVRLSIGDEFVESDSNGRFALRIPVPQQAEQYDLVATHPDYRTWEATVYPATKQAVKIVMQP